MIKARILLIVKMFSCRKIPEKIFSKIGVQRPIFGTLDAVLYLRQINYIFPQSI